MKQSAKPFHKKLLLIISCVVVVALVAVAALTITSYKKSLKEFETSGYVLVPSEEEALTTDVNELHYFSAGTTYREKYGKVISFKDTSNNRVTIDKEEFIHYTDGSLKSFSNGVIMNLMEVGDKQVSYFGVSDKTTLVKNGTQYEMSYLGDKMQIQEFIWKIADDTYMVIAPRIKVHLSKDKEVTLDDYVQLKYVDGGIVRLIHEQGTYQTVSSDAYLLTDGGVMLELISKHFIVDGEKALSLESMIIDSNDNLNLDENEDKIKLPTFNVINGSNGADGESGASGDDGEQGESGEIGDNGNAGDKGNAGGNGQNGQSGNDGSDGPDGEQGEEGNLGYDGKDGDDGEDANSSVSPDGIGSIEQPSAPTVSIITEDYFVGANVADIWVRINDKDGLLTDNLKWTIYTREGYKYVAGYDKQFHPEEGLISSFAQRAEITTQKLQPDTEYVLVVSGTYATDYGEFNQDFLTKVFSTDILGIKLNKVQVTSDKIVVKVTVSDDSQISSYGIALYDENDPNNFISRHDLAQGTNAGTKEFTFSVEENLLSGKELYPDSNYVVKIVNVQSKASSDILPVDISLDIATLKTTPYYVDDSVTPAVKVPVSSIKTKAVPSDRYRTVTLSLEQGIKDPDNGIKGYRYELYTTANTTAGNGELVATKEVDSLQNVAFDVDPAYSYYGKVVVIFKDNEKTVEIPSSNSDVVTMDKRTYPSTNITFDIVDYDTVEGVITIEDKNRMVIDNVSAEFPLKVLIIGADGNVEGITLAYENERTIEGDKATYYFKQDGLKRNTTYSITVSGPVNTTNLDWTNPEFGDRHKYANFYLGGVNFTTSDPTPLKANFVADKNVTGNNAFQIRYSITSPSGDQDVAYEVGNLERITFALYDSNHNQIGTNYTVTDVTNDVYNHISDFSLIYDKESPTYSTQYVLTDASFGVAGDSRITGGGDFYIKIVDSADYTSNDTDYPHFTNKMDWDTTSIEFPFTVAMKHTYSNDVNGAVEIEKIENVDADALFYKDSLKDSTVVGLVVTPDYSWSDAKSITYYVYKVDVNANEPVVEADSILYKSNWRYLVDGNLTGGYIQPVGTKTITLSTSSYGTNVNPWTVYFDDVSNIADDGVTKLFERGYTYFVRYEVTCDGTIGGELAYPDCLYVSEETPFYRSQIFSVLRQKPELYRYLWNTSKSGSELTHQWKYIVNDPDNAIFAVGENPVMYVCQPSNDYDTALLSLDKTVTARRTGAKVVSLSDLYTVVGNAKKWETSYKTLSLTGLVVNNYYNTEVDYRLCTYATGRYGAKTDTLSSKFYHVENITPVNTTIANSADALKHFTNNSDYFVNGVMVKGLGLVKGIAEEGGYRIKLTLQGVELDRIAAIKVTLTSKNDPTKVVVYDPVSISIATNSATGGKDSAGNTISNNYAYAYLEYAPIVAARMTETDVYVNVSAYCKTGQMGLSSFMNYSTYQDPVTGLFTAQSAWALRSVRYSESEGYVERAHFIRLADDGTPTLEASPLMNKVNNATDKYPTIQSSLILPHMTKATDEIVNNSGFALATDAIDVAYLTAMYTTVPLSTLDSPQLSVHQLEYEIDENGMRDIQDMYYTVERLELKELQLDFSETSPFYTGEFETGSGLPAISLNDNKTSVGRGSATIVFDTKGTFPVTYDDHTIYYELKDELTGLDIALTKYYYDDDKNVRHYFYATGDYIPESYEHECPSSDLKGMEIVMTPGTNVGMTTVVIRGLKPSTDLVTQKYTVYAYVKDNNGDKQYMFDNVKEQVKYPYTIKTVGNINIPINTPLWIYPTYSGKSGSFRFAVNGSEGTNMMIYFKVYDKNGNEVKPGSLNSSYTTVNGIGYGYRVAPLGNIIKYYDSDPNTNNPIYVNMQPGGALELGTEYKLEVTAYEVSNGNVNFSSKLGTSTYDFVTPNNLAAPRASVRITKGQTNIKVSINMTDTNRIIMGDEYVVSIYNVDGVLVEEKTVEIGNTGDSTTISSDVNFINLTPNTMYTVKINARLDKNNDGAADGTYEDEINTSTITNAEASVVYEFTPGGNLVLTLCQCINFDNVGKVMYSIYSEDAKQYYTSGDVHIDDWTQISVSGSEAYMYEITNWAPLSSVTYSYIIQYYSETGELLGTTTGFFKRS